MDGHYPGCRIDGKFIKKDEASTVDNNPDAGSNGSSNNITSNGSITIKKEELVKLVAGIVNNIISKDN